MKSKIHRRLAPVLAFFLLWAVGSVVTVPADPQTVIAPSEVKIAPALAPTEDSEFRKELLLKIAFQAMNPVLMGVATFEGRSVCYLKHSGSSEQMMYSVGDVIGGFQIVKIETQTVVFERNAKQFWINLEDAEQPAAGSSSESIPTAPLLNPEKFSIPEEDQPLKVAQGSLKKVVRHLAVINKVETRVREKVIVRRAVVGGGRFGFPANGFVSSPFGHRRNPMGGGRKAHHGIDIAASYGSQVTAASAGTVQKVGHSIDYGRYVIVSHDRGFTTFYCHLSRQSVREGEHVSQGEVIGLVGSSGRSTGPHLHFEIRVNGDPVDPQIYLRK